MLFQFANYNHAAQCFFFFFVGEFLHCGYPPQKKKKPSANSTKAFYGGKNAKVATF